MYALPFERKLWRLVRANGLLAITIWGRCLFEPTDGVFWEAVRREDPDLYRSIKPSISPRPSGTGIFPYSRMPALKAPAYFQSASPRRVQPSSDLARVSPGNELSACGTR